MVEAGGVLVAAGEAVRLVDLFGRTGALDAARAVGVRVDLRARFVGQGDHRAEGVGQVVVVLPPTGHGVQRAPGLTVESGVHTGR